MRVDGPLARGSWPPVGGRLCRRVVEKGCGKGFLGWTGLGHTCGVRVLKMDGPSAQGFLGLTAFQAEGCGIARRAMSIKSALRDLLSVSYDMISILVISRYAAPPYPAAPDFPPSGGQNKLLHAFL